jgi:MFS family permease
VSEIAPFKWRGSLNFFFQVFFAFGSLIASLINYGNARTGNAFGWRISLGLAGIPAIMLTLASLVICETPNSLVQRGYQEKAKKILQQVRGTQDVEVEFEDILIAAKKSTKHDHAKVDQLDPNIMISISPFSSFNEFRNVLKSKTSQPALIISCLLQFFSTFAIGGSAIQFYVPILLSTFHFKSTTSLFWSAMFAVTMVLSTMVGSVLVDRLGRKQLLITCNFFMFICLVSEP